MSIKSLFTDLLSGFRPDVHITSARILDEINKDVEGSLIVLLMEMMTSTDIDAKTRVAAGNMLSDLGDPRFLPGFFFLPDEDLLGFVKIPSGQFIMGSKRETYDGPIVPISPQRKIDLPDFYIGRYDVTVAQYKSFVEDAGYKLDFDEGLRRGLNNHPMKWLTWFEAMDYCKWLNQKLLNHAKTPKHIQTLLNEGWKITLPNEAEWEKAARGTDGRIYPWGNKFSSNNANILETGITESALDTQDGTSPVGAFPLGASPYGIHDMCGNVWNWTRSIAQEKKRYEGVEDLNDKQSKRILRGVPNYNDSSVAHSSHRFSFPPDVSDNGFGFRLAIIKQNQ